MIELDHDDHTQNVRLVLRLPEHLGGDRVQVLGDWNQWSSDTAVTMERINGEHVAVLTLPRGHAYQFRYLIDGNRWENDPAAHDYRPNGYGGYDSVIDLTDDPFIDATDP